MSSVFTARDLITSNATLPSNLLVKDLVDWFKAHPEIEYATVIDQEGICGLVGRETLNARIASNKFGFSVLAEKPVTKVMTEDPLIVEAGLSAVDLVRQLIKDRGHSPMHQFYEDIVVHEGGNFLGLASVRRLIVKQMDYIMEQMRSMEKAQFLLTKKNRELFETSLRLESDQTLFQNFFEKCSIPIVVFEPDGRLIKANPRFAKLSGYTAEDWPEVGTASRLFTSDDFNDMLQRHEATRHEPGAYRPTYTLTLIKQDGEPQGVEVSCSRDEKNGQIIVSFLRAVDAEEMAVRAHVQERVAESTPLARSVAENLIDKETNLNAAMAKLDHLIRFANEIEDKPKATESGKVSLANLSGDLGQFSIVDLAQLLVQGRKSGELTVAREDGASGVAYFERGLIVHALFQGQRGRTALRALLAIERGSFLFNYNQPAPDRSLDGTDPMGVLLDGCAEADEYESFSEDEPILAEVS